MTRALVLVGGLGTGAFQSGVVTALAESGRRWDVVVGSGAGALNALLSVDDRFDAMARLWREGAATGTPLLADLAESAHRALAKSLPGARVVLDPRAVEGVLDVGGVAVAVAAWSEDLPERLARRHRRLLLPILDLATGHARLVEPAVELDARDLSVAVAAASATAVACTPVPLTLPGGRRPHPCVDGFSSLARPLREVVSAVPDDTLREIDVVLGVAPPSGDTAVAPLGLAEIAASVEAVRITAAVEADLADLVSRGASVRLLRPEPASWRVFCERVDADVRLEFPAPLSRNGALSELSEAYGRQLATLALD